MLFRVTPTQRGVYTIPAPLSLTYEMTKSYHAIHISCFYGGKFCTAVKSMKLKIISEHSTKLTSLSQWNENLASVQQLG